MPADIVLKFDIDMSKVDPIIERIDDASDDCANLEIIEAIQSRWEELWETQLEQTGDGIMVHFAPTESLLILVGLLRKPI